jgi:hypothetical protein
MGGTCRIRSSDPPYLEVNAKEVEPAVVKVSRTASRITATFRAPQDGTYSFGLSISAAEITRLAPGTQQYGCALFTEPLIVRYPYDWTARDFI